MFVVVGEALVDLVGRRGDRTFSAQSGWQPGKRRAWSWAAGRRRDARPSRGGGTWEVVRLEASGVRVDGGADEDAKTGLAIASLAAGITSCDSPGSTGMWRSWRLPVNTLFAHRFVGDGPPRRQSERRRPCGAGAQAGSGDRLIRPRHPARAARRRGAGPTRTSSVSSHCPMSSRPATATTLFAGSTPTATRTSRELLARLRGPLLVVVTRGGFPPIRRLRGPGAAPRRGADRSGGHGRRG